MTSDSAVSSGLDLETLEFTLESIGEFARRELPDSLLIELDDRDEFPAELVRKMSSDELGIQLLFIADEYGGMGGRRVRRLPRLRAARLARPRSCDLRTRHVPGLGPGQRRRDRGAEAPDHGADRERGRVDGVRRDRARRRQRPGVAEDDGRPPSPRTAAISGYRLNGAKQWISNGGVAEMYDGAGDGPRRPDLVRRRPRHRGLHARRAREQARHPAQQHLRAVPRGRLRRRRSPDRRGRGPGPRPGPAGVRVHASDGRRLRPRCRLGGARPRDRLFPRADPGRRPAVGEAGLHAQADRPARRRARGRARGDRGDRDQDRCGGRARSTSRAPSPSTSRPRRATPPPTPRSRPTAATATRTNTWSRRSSATSASPGSTRAPRRSWR